ncbi:hypothetical protein F0460_07540 [Paenimyroides baculatum]|uniref:Uncharacterized protein n=2 Tax=Paenimyroides baculatum TaxID=2608000 RepID=A0A5M6CR76_9FLAO|nr:hypothetical protein F0460_07540 [Paenimyroides baculatum]
MNNMYPDPWNFSNTDKNMVAPNGKYSVTFSELSEIAMGGPLKGICYLILGSRKIKICDHAGGPIIWNEAGDCLALPVWTRNRKQQIGILDINSQTQTLFRNEFNVLHLKKFQNNMVSGIDSPLHKSNTLNFDLSIAEISYVKELFFD